MITARLATFAAFSTAMLLSTSALCAVEVGVVGAADNVVSVTSDNGATRNVAIGDHIYANDTISTGKKGKAQLMFKDRSTITINENSTIIIDKFIYNPDNESGQMVVNNVKGALRFIGGSLSKKHPVNIKTPIATIGIRGGIADSYVGEQGKTEAMFLYGDQMTLTNQDGVTQSVTSFGSGLSLDTANSIPAPIPAARIAQQLYNFANITSNGGGLITPPDSNAVSPINTINTKTRTPASSTGSPAPVPLTIPRPDAQSQRNNSLSGKNNASAQPSQTAQTAAPITMVDNDISVPVGNALSQEVSTQQMTIRMQGASATPEILATMATSESLSRQRQVSPELDSRLRSIGNGVSLTPPQQPAPLAQTPVNILPETTALTPTAINTASNTTSSASNTTPLPPVYSATNTSFSSVYHISRQSGDYVIDRITTPTVIGSSDNAFRVDIEGNRYRLGKASAGNADRVEVLRLNALNIPVIDKQLNSDHFSTPNNAMTSYRFAHPDNIDNGEGSEHLSLVTGRNIYNHAPNIPTALQEAGTIGRAATTGANAIHGTETHGTLLYQFGHTLTGSWGDSPSDNLDIAIQWDAKNDGSGNNKYVSSTVNWDDANPSVSVIHGTINNTASNGGKYFEYDVDNASRTAEASNETIFMPSLYANEGDVVEGAVIEGFENETFVGAATIGLNQNASANLISTVERQGTESKQYGYSAGVIGNYDGTTHVNRLVANHDGDRDHVFVHTNSNNNHNLAQMGLKRIAITNSGIIAKGVNIQGQFSSANDGAQESTYINDNYYVGVQSNNDGNSIITSENGEYRCETCEFTHWGVWAGEANGDGNESHQVNLVPYVVGDALENINTVAHRTATYSGDAFATVFNNTENNIQDATNIVGTMDATVSFAGANSTLDTFDLDFGTINGEDLSLTMDTPADITDTGAAEFHTTGGDYAIPLQSASPTTTIDGAMNGGLYGNQGQEIGGNYVFKRQDDGLEGGGIYIGAQ